MVEPGLSVMSALPVSSAGPRPVARGAAERGLATPGPGPGSRTLALGRPGRDTSSILIGHWSVLDTQDLS